MKKILIIGIPIAIIIVIIILINFLRPNKQNRELKKLMDITPNYDKLLKINYSNSGDSNGNIYNIVIDIDNKKIIEESKKEYGSPLVIKEYKISDSNINELIHDIERYNFPMWKDLETDYSEVALDAPTTTISFMYDNSNVGGTRLDTYSLTFYLKIPEDGKKILSDFIKKIKDLLKEENKIKEYIDEKE